MLNRRDFLYCLAITWCYLFVTTKCQLCEESRPYYSPTTICKNIKEKYPPFAKPVYNLKCIDCSIPIVDENTVSNFVGEVFNLSSSHVQKINPGAFKSIKNNIHKFLFEDNEISYIAPRVFSNFSMLDDINLRKNSIEQLPTGIFDNTSVSNLDLSYNHLSDISTIFRGLKVNTLNLSCNEIVTFPQKTFENTSFWPGRQWRFKPQQIDLSNNFIEKIYPGTFKSNTKDTGITSLNLKNNKFSAVDNDTFADLSFLSTLNLEGNAITELHRNSFRGLRSLTNLVLKNNAIQKIPPGSFSELQNLEYLDLSLNQLTAFETSTFSGLFHLIRLNISHNNLKVLDESYIFPLGRLVSLDISDTRLSGFNLQPIFQHHKYLRTLIINDNFWTCNHLVEMYKLMNQRLGGFDYPSHHYDVPNLHGIACSRQELGDYNEMTFNNFLEVISQNTVFGDLHDSSINQDYEDYNVDDITNLFERIAGIHRMLLVITIICVLLFIHFIIRCVCIYFYRRNILPNNKLCFAYTANNDNVELI